MKRIHLRLDVLDGWRKDKLIPVGTISINGEPTDEDVFSRTWSLHG